MSGSRSNPLDDLVGDLISRVPAPLSLTPGPWPVPTGVAGVGDEALRALLADDWAGTRMSAGKLRKLIDTQLVSRHRELAADHPNARDLGIATDDRIVGRILLDVDLERPGEPFLLVDISLQPDHQRRGIGTRLLGALFAAAHQQGRALHATGVYGSAALAWLLRLGMVDVGGDALYRHLVRPAG